jgi:hypothetical protein
MTKTLVALVLIAGGILLVTRVVDTDKPVPSRLSPPTSVDQMSEARRVSPTISARDVCNLIDPWQKCSALFEAQYYGCRSKDRHASRSRKPLQRVRRCRTRYEKSRRANGARLDTARPFEQGRAGKLLSLVAVFAALNVRFGLVCGVCAARSPIAASCRTADTTLAVPRSPGRGVRARRCS